MNIILLDKIGQLGDLGDQVSVKAGYARNYLLPQGKAVVANAANVKAFEARRAELEAKLASELGAARQRADSLSALGKVTIASKAGDEGKLFGSVGTKDIAAALTSAGVAVSKAEVRLPHGALRSTGEYNIDLHLHAEVDTKVTVEIVAKDD